MPTQIVSSDKYLPTPQTAQQKQVEAWLIAMSDRLAKRQGQSRHGFFQTAAGMAASFVAMNAVFGRYFDASEAEAATPELADQRAAAHAGQFIFDGHTPFLPPRRGADGDARQGPWARPHRLGYRCGMDRRATMADRRLAPAGNPRGHAEEARLQAAGPADGPLKTAIFGGNSAGLYGLDPQHAELVGNEWR